MTKEKTSNKYLTVLGVIALGITIYFGQWNEGRLQDNRDQEDQEYIKINKTNKRIEGRLISKRTSRGYTGTTLMILNNNMKISFSGLTRNYEISRADFDSFLQIGDSIYKPLHSDSIYVYRNNKEYYFILGKAINKKE